MNVPAGSHALSSLSSSRGPTRSVVEQITDQIVELVLTGELKPGQPLPINELAAALGVSHIPVREALRRLESEGLIQYQRGKGAQVAPVSSEDLVGVFNLRAALEADIARRSVSGLDAETLARAERHLLAFIDALEESRSPATVSPEHTAFHYALLPGATSWDRRVLDQIYRATERYRQLYRGYAREQPAALENTIEAHRRLLADAQAGGKRYVNGIREHVTWSRDSLMPFSDAGTEPTEN